MENNEYERIEEEPKQQLKYVMQLAELFLNPRLNKIDCLVFNLVELYDKDKHCYASNGYLAAILGVSATTISTSISRLKKENYIEEVSFNGRNRTVCIKSDYKELNKQHIKDLKDRRKAYLTLLLKGKHSKITNQSKKLSSKEERSETDVSHPTSSKLHKRSKGQMLMNAKLPLKPLKEKKTVKPYEPTSKAVHLIRYWESKGLHVPAPDTKSYRDSLVAFDKLLSGKAFNGTEYDDYENKKIDSKDIKKTIDRFAYMALNSDYEPRDINFKKKLSKITPSNFIYSSFAPVNGYGRSKFINCLENEPKLIREKDVFVEDKYPITSKKVANQFKERILGGADIKFTNGDINDFRKAANFATDLFKSNKGKLMGSYANMEPFRIVNCLFEALESSGADLKKVKPHWLCNSVMQKQLPQYLYQSAIFQDIDCSAKEKAIQYHNFGEPFRG